MIEKDPPPGCSAWAAGDSVHELEAVIQGADDTPYAKGCFRLRITVPQRYPFEPPKVHFVTPIYHPNIDSAGRICLDILNMPPKASVSRDVECARACGNDIGAKAARARHRARGSPRSTYQRSSRRSSCSCHTQTPTMA